MPGSANIHINIGTTLTLKTYKISSQFLAFAPICNSYSICVLVVNNHTCSQCVKVAYCSLVPMAIFFLLMDYSSQFVSQQGCLARDHVSSFLTAWYGLMTDQVLATGINKSISDIFNFPVISLPLLCPPSLYLEDAWALLSQFLLFCSFFKISRQDQYPHGMAEQHNRRNLGPWNRADYPPWCICLSLVVSKKKNSKLLYYLRHCIFSFLYSTV